jgi:hypothetical protein
MSVSISDANEVYFGKMLTPGVWFEIVQKTKGRGKRRPSEKCSCWNWVVGIWDALHSFF